MSDGPVVRRVGVQEWREIRALRLQALADPVAEIAFLTTLEQERARTDAFWQERAAGAAIGENAAQFVAIAGSDWVGTATVLLREDGDAEPGRHAESAGEMPSVCAGRADVVAVYVSPRHRGVGILDALFEAAAEFAALRGASALTLDVHPENERAQRAYRRLGFAPTGVTVPSAIGRHIEMRRALDARVGA